MFARKVSMHLKAAFPSLPRLWKGKSFPCFENRKDSGTKSRLSHREEKEAFGISLWENKENAETYNRGTYPEVTKILARVVEGTPQVETYIPGTKIIAKSD
jgi:hypothetical protein